MPHLLPATERRSSIVLLSPSEIALSAHQSEDVDALLGETIDLLPLSTLVALTERARAA